jgi:predicted hydrocarbon binding protein
MHGTMFVHLRKFVEEHHGIAAWDAVMTRSGLGPRVYLPITSYPDEELAAIVTAASALTGIEVPLLLQAFGEHVAPHLMAMYRHLLKPSWRTLEVLENVEQTAHRAVRLEKTGAAPPYLQTERSGEHEVTIHYTSARRLCHVAKGIVQGLARHFGEEIAIAEPACMHRGAEQCRLTVRVAS